MASDISPFAGGTNGNNSQNPYEYDLFGGYNSYKVDTSKTMAGAVSATANAIGKGSKFVSSDFSMGFKAGRTAVSNVTSALLAYQSAKTEKKILGMQAELSDLTAKSYQTAAEDVLRSGNRQVAAITFKAGQQKANTKVQQASSGVKVAGSGSAAEALTAQDIAKEMQVNQTLANAVVQSFGYRRQQTQAKMNSLALRSAQSRISPWAAAICAHAQSVMNTMNFVSDFKGSGSGGLSGGGSYEAPSSVDYSFSTIDTDYIAEGWGG